MHDGIKQSCDIYFYDLARKVGIERISEMANRLGLGETTGIELPGERAGLIPTREWKLATIGEKWQGGETLVTAIGQGFVLATPLQLAVMTARIANGGFAVRPTLVRGFGDEMETGQGEDAANTPGTIAGNAPGSPSGDVPDAVMEATPAHVAQVAASRFSHLGFSETHLKVVQDVMDAVTNHERGTAYRSRIQQEDWQMAGKTGTSQVRRISLSERQSGVKKNEDLEWRYRDHALFVGFAPVHRPRYCCAVVVEHGGSGSRAAAPIVRDILAETQRRDPSAAGLRPLAAGQANRKA